MFNHPFKKAFGLIVLYTFIIIGIFVLQFRNESVISRNTGLLSFSLAQSQEADGSLVLKNSMQVGFKGISFFADEITPAKLSMFGKTEPMNLTFVSYEQVSPLAYTFRFTNDVSLTFSVSDTSSNASLTIAAAIPDNAESISLNYKPTSGFSVTEKTKTKLMLNSKNTSYSFTASKIDDNLISFTPRNLQAIYSIYDPAVQFTFAALEPNMAITQKSSFDSNIRSFRSSVVSQIDNAIQNSQNLTEKSIIAYVAENAAQGKFAKAVTNVPDSFKKGNKRTYLSSPYFNTLEAMYSSLIMYNENMMEMIVNSVASKSLNVFTVSNIADYINILPINQNIKSLLAMPEQFIAENKITLAQAVGILKTYIRLAELHSSLSESLHSAAEHCISIIEANCVLTDSSLTLVDKDTPVSSIVAFEAGMSLIHWGEFNSSDLHKMAGYAIVNSAFAQTAFDNALYGDIYPILVNNINYPHYAILHRTESDTIWAWTCASVISYSSQGQTASINIRFNKNDSHYLTVCNIDPFQEIEIYGLSFHSDSRFESYNSSGFIYREQNKTLFLKTRQKSETETVRLTYGKKPEPVLPAAPKAAPKVSVPQTAPETPKPETPVNTTAVVSEPKPVENTPSEADE